MARRSVGDVTQAGLLELVLSMCLFMTAFVTSISMGPGASANLLMALPILILLLFMGLLLLKHYVIDPRGASLADVRPTHPVLLLFGIFALYLVFSQESFGVAAFLGTPLFLAALLSGLFLLIGQERRRFYVYAATTLVVAAVVNMFGIDDTPGAIWVMLATACVLMLMGGWVLADFVRQSRS